MSDETRREDTEQENVTRIEASHSPPLHAQSLELQPTTLESDTAQENPKTSTQRGWLPSNLANRYSFERAFDARGAEADTYLVKDQQGREFFAKVYRRGIEPDAHLLRLLRDNESEHIVKIFDFGISDESWYEIQEFAKFGTLAEYLRNTVIGSSTKQAEVIVEQLNDALCHIHSLGIEHRDLKPENILIRRLDPFKLIITDFGIASNMRDASVRWTNSNRTTRYGPPESITGTVFRTAYDYWSLGMILVEALSGKHPFEGLNEQLVASRLVLDLNTDVLADDVLDKKWNKLCRGLLRRDPKLRWGNDEIRKWLNDPDDASLFVQDETPNQHQTQPFKFLGKELFSTSDLADAFATNWKDAGDIWKRHNQALRDWIRHELGLIDVADRLESIDKEINLNLDTQLFMAIHVLAPDRTPSYKGEELTSTNLGKLLLGVWGRNEEANSIIWEIYSNDILALSSRLPSADSSIDAILRSWSIATKEYRNEVSRLDEEVGHTTSQSTQENETLRLLALSTLSDKKILNKMRTDANRASSRAATDRPWFRSLGEPKKATPAKLLLMLRYSKIAEVETEQLVAQRRMANQTIRNQLLKYAFISGSIPAIGWAILSFTGFGEISWPLFENLTLFAILPITLGCAFIQYIFKRSENP